MPNIIEMRTYKVTPGHREKFLEIFRAKSIPAHAEIGIKVLGPFPSVDDPNVFFWMRAFPEASSREGMKKKFYDGDLWNFELKHILLPMLEQYECVVVEDLAGIFDE